MKTETQGSIIVAHQAIETIEFAPLDIDHDQAVEEMVSGLLYANPNLTDANFPNVHSGKTGIEEVKLCDVRPVPSGQSWATDKVLAALDEAGFIPEDLPALTVQKDHIDELRAAGINYLTALGDGSRWQDPDGLVCVPCLSLGSREFGLCSLGRQWFGSDWFVVRRK